MYKNITHRKVFLSTVLIFALVLAMTSCGSEPVEEGAPPQPEVTAPEEAAPVPDPEPEPDQESEYEQLVIPGGPYAGAFTFSNESGTKLMVMPDSSYSVGNAPESFDVAIGPGGKTLQVKYSGTQEGTGDPGDYISPNSQNFEAMFGHVFEVIGGKVEPDIPYFVTTSGVFAKSMISIKADTNMGWRQEPLPVARDSAIKKHENEKGLKVIYSETLATVGSGGYLELFQYERDGNNMLFEIVYDDGTQEIVAEFPAEYDEYSTWRADAGDSPGIWIPMFFCEIEDTLVMSTLWAAPEGGNLTVWFDNGGVWTQDEYLTTYWYWG